jgi:uncharacterized membrane protein YdjX (TVP38/TMEM64 family)
MLDAAITITIGLTLAFLIVRLGTRDRAAHC